MSHLWWRREEWVGLYGRGAQLGNTLRRVGGGRGEKIGSRYDELVVRRAGAVDVHVVAEALIGFPAEGATYKEWTWQWCRSVQHGRGMETQCRHMCTEILNV